MIKQKTKKIFQFFAEELKSIVKIILHSTWKLIHAVLTFKISQPKYCAITKHQL